MAFTQKSMCSSSGTPSSCAPCTMSWRANALSLAFFEGNSKNQNSACIATGHALRSHARTTRNSSSTQMRTASRVSGQARAPFSGASRTNHALITPGGHTQRLPPPSGRYLCVVSDVRRLSGISVECLRPAAIESAPERRKTLFVGAGPEWTAGQSSPVARLCAERQVYRRTVICGGRLHGGPRYRQGGFDRRSAPPPRQ